nr:hypothetical protein [Chromobacterium sp. ASV5]
MEIVLFAALIAAVVALARMLAVPVEKQPKLVPIRIRHDEGQRRR